MAVWEVELDGQLWEIEGPEDRPPDEGEARQAVSSMMRKPTPPFRLVDMAAQFTTPPFLQAAQGATAFMPEGALEPALGVAGGAVGQASRVPFGATMGAGAGAAFGKTLALQRQAQRTGGYSKDAESQVAGSGLAGAGSVLGPAALFRTGSTLFRGGARVLSNKAGSSFGRLLRNKAYERYRKAGEMFGQQIDELERTNPGKVVDVTQELDDFKTVFDTSPGLKAAVETGQRKAGSTLITDILKNGRRELTMKEAQQLKRIISQVPEVSSRLNKGRGAAQYSDTGVELLGLKEGIRTKQLSTFGDEAKSAFKSYRDAAEDFRMVQPKLRKGTLQRGGVPKLGEDPDVGGAFQRSITPGFRRQVREVNVFKGGSKLAGIGTAAAIAKRLFVDPITNVLQSK